MRPSYAQCFMAFLVVKINIACCRSVKFSFLEFIITFFFIHLRNKKTSFLEATNLSCPFNNIQVRHLFANIQLEGNQARDF